MGTGMLQWQSWGSVPSTQTLQRARASGSVCHTTHYRGKVVPDNWNGSSALVLLNNHANALSGPCRAVLMSVCSG